MDNKKITIIDFFEQCVDKYADNVFLKEKNSGTWTETTYKRTQQYHPR